MNELTSTIQGSRSLSSDGDYRRLLEAIPSWFAAATEGEQVLYTTSRERGGPDLWDLFLSNIPEALRQTHTCNACRDFVRTYGGLAVVSKNGLIEPVFWEESFAGENVGVFGEAVAAIARAIRNSRVTGVFYTAEALWGKPETGHWHHLSVTPPARFLFSDPLVSAWGARAKKDLERTLLIKAVLDFPFGVAQSAVKLLEGDHLYRSEVVLGQAKWFLELQRTLLGLTHKLTWEAAIWHAVANAPAGFCHLRNGMLGTVLSDLAAGLSFRDIQARFGEKMDPTRYQRPTAAPTVGAIDEAERVMRTLGVEAALARRFARLEDLDGFLWRPGLAEAPQPAEGGGVFDRLRPRPVAVESIETPATTMSWDKFRRRVLSGGEVQSIEFYVPARPISFVALTTAVDPAAPPLLRWDRPESGKRNPVGWYAYEKGVSPGSVNLRSGTYCRVTAITSVPSEWASVSDEAPAEGVILFLEGARDLDYTVGGLLFPESLRAEFHAIRRVLEAYSKVTALAGKDEATACGVAWGSTGGGGGRPWRNPYRLRVTTKTGPAMYDIDRWD